MMMLVRYYDRHGRPITRRVWQRLGARPEYAQLALHELTADGSWPAQVPGVRLAGAHRVVVATFWLGVVTDPRQRPPLIYRTVAGGYGPGEHPVTVQRWGWPTRTAARAGHGGVVAWLTGTAAAPPAPWPALIAGSP
ncbi:hypothetical protein [Actinomadura opuntiae]|uniref:hypothetical protein n=1 Tax=Actinomadura sp. OS1-43 TaxID=604315 RepID=UPI00255AB9D6|nr:hypothetical protein [Actinomadura sp. OS1-43]MDL4813108.1 hypothetical protein [Actinomadura sp. OS1-43]